MSAARVFKPDDPMSVALVPGDLVRVRDDYPPGHIRTPVYVRGKIGARDALFRCVRKSRASRLPA